MTRFFSGTAVLFMHTFRFAEHTILMKKQKHLPDFRQLCTPEQNDTASTLSQLIFFFFLTSVGGFLWEVLLLLINEHTFANRGFLYGPWLPVYGTGAVLFYLLLKRFEKHPVTVFLLSLLIGSGLELVIGWFLDAIWNLRYWDYRGYVLNVHGYICLWSAIGFGIAGVIWVCVLSGIFSKWWLLLSTTVRTVVLSVLILLFLVDCAAALIIPNIGNYITFSAVTFHLLS